jgi:hypothetical protein
VREGEREDVGDWEEDLEGERVTETVTLEERVQVPLEEVLGDTVPERLIDGERDRLGEVDIVEDSEVLEQ